MEMEMEMEPLPTQVAEKKGGGGGGGGGGDEAATLLVHHISTSNVHHSRQLQVEEQQCHLNPWDLSFLSIPYHQRGLLFPKPSTSHHHHNKQQQQQEEEGEGEEEKQEPPIVSLLRSSLASALNHFYPLAGRLATTCHDEYDTITVSIDCNNQGAQFTHAMALALTASDVLTPLIKPNVVASFFSLAAVVGHDGHSSSLLVVQITELSDAIFVGVTANHCAVDARSLWHFINTWSAIARHGRHSISPISFPPILDRWFPPPPFPSPIHLPFSGDSSTFIKRPITTPTSPDLAEATFHFSKTTISNLITGAEAPELSALEVVLAHFWVSTTRARRLDPDSTTVYIIVIDFREKLNPPLPLQYFGNAVQTPVASERAGELLRRGLGWAAMLIHKSIAAETDEVGRRWVESWVKDPRLRYVNGGGGFGAGSLFTASSPEYDVYGNDFGWGRPVAVMSGGEEGRFDGRTAVFGGREEGSMELEACLPVTVLESLMEDDEFMGQVVRASIS